MKPFINSHKTRQTKRLWCWTSRSSLVASHKERLLDLEPFSADPDYGAQVKQHSTSGSYNYLKTQ